MEIKHSELKTLQHRPYVHIDFGKIYQIGVVAFMLQNIVKNTFIVNQSNKLSSHHPPVLQSSSARASTSYCFVEEAILSKRVDTCMFYKHTRAGMPQRGQTTRSPELWFVHRPRWRICLLVSIVKKYMHADSEQRTEQSSRSTARGPSSYCLFGEETLSKTVDTCMFWETFTSWQAVTQPDQQEVMGRLCHDLCCYSGLIMWGASIIEVKCPTWKRLRKTFGSFCRQSFCRNSVPFKAELLGSPYIGSAYIELLRSFYRLYTGWHCYWQGILGLRRLCTEAHETARTYPKDPRDIEGAHKGNPHFGRLLTNTPCSAGRLLSAIHSCTAGYIC